VEPFGIWMEIVSSKSLSPNSVQNADGEYGRISPIIIPILIRKSGLNI
jgi:hypothetical protein